MEESFNKRKIKIVVISLVLSEFEEKSSQCSKGKSKIFNRWDRKIKNLSIINNIKFIY